MRLEQTQWGCRVVWLQDSACVLDARASGDQTWQKGYKITMSWPDPGLDEHGRPYERCRMSPSIGVFWHFLAPANPIPTIGVQLTVDVPAAWGSTTLPITEETSFPGGVVPGRSMIDVRYACYSIEHGEKHWSPTMTAADQLLPDLPPTEPTDVQADVVEGGIDASASGAVTLGAAQLQGYELQVLDASGAVVASASIPASEAVPMRMTATTVARTSTRLHRFAGLRPGHYSVRAVSFNSVGESDPVVSRGAVVPAQRPVPALTAPRKITASGKHRIRLHWSAPSSTGAGVVRDRVTISKGGRVVQRANVRSSVRSFVFKRLARTGRYRVVLTVAAKDAHQVGLEGRRRQTVT